MATQMREQWGSRIGFVLAAAGGAVGLGNIWRFPTTAGSNGGGLFVLLYAFCVLVIGAPIMLAEFSIGRSTQTNVVGAFRKLAPGTPWFLFGGMAVLTGFIILGFYSVVGGWIIGYLFSSAVGTIGSGASSDLLDSYFKIVAQDPAISIFFLLVFLGLTVLIIYAGVGDGIERWSKILMPILLVLLTLVIIRGLLLAGSLRGLEFLFVPRIADFKPGTLAAALGQAFFSLSLGMGAMITYGSYLRRNQNLPNSALQVAGLDTLIAILAGLAIFPAIFSMSPELSFSDAPGGKSLIFVAFPQIFLSMFGGNMLMAQAFGLVFFLLILIAALTSSISLLEVITAYFVDERGWSRKKTAVIMGTVVFFMGIPSAISNEVPEKTFSVLGMSFFDFVDLIANEYMLPLGGFFISIFVAWKWGRARALEQVRIGGGEFRLADLWHFILRWIAPLIIMQIILLRIIHDISEKNVLDVSEQFVINLQWALTAVDAVLLLAVLVGGVWLWFRKSAGARPAE